MDLKDRIGIDLGRRIRLEEGNEWAARDDLAAKAVGVGVT